MSRLTRRGENRPPVRIVHLGLGNFFRAHQAWYTGRAADAEDWGIAAFTGRRPGIAADLAAQDGLYTLVTRGGDHDEFEVVRSVVAVHDAAQHAAWLAQFSAPELAVVTLTVTEAGYLLSESGELARSAAVVADVAALRTSRLAPVGTVPGRLLAGLLARAEAGYGPVAVLPCDNLPQNGAVAATVVGDLARLVDPHLEVSALADFGSTMVDRITPRTTPADVAAVLAGTGVRDPVPVVTEEFSEWVIGARFPAGRPSWQSSGVRFADDVALHERRKLWLLNGAHSLLAYAGSIRGHRNVAEAVGDPVLWDWVEQWWDEAGAHLGLPQAEVESYRAALQVRWQNARIDHLLAQIAADGSQKVPVRVLPVLRAERAAGRLPRGAARILASWIAHLSGQGASVDDAGAARYVDAAAQAPTAVRRVLALLDASLAEDDELGDLVGECLAEVRRGAG